MQSVCVFCGGGDGVGGGGDFHPTEIDSHRIIVLSRAS